MIEVKHLTKRYGSHTAVSDLSFTVEKGQIYGFLGPNGAGKSTTMNIMTGCLAATSGEVVIGGYDIFQDAAQAKRLIGYLPEQPPLYLDRTPKEYLRFVARAKVIPEKNISAELDRVMTVTGTLDVADRLMKNLSKGYRQRVGIAQAVLGDPEVIILDEPTVGLDPRQITEIRELIRQLGKERTVILSSHILSEVQQVCTTILILSKGKLVACDTPENLERLFAGKSTVELTAEDLARVIEIWTGIPATEITENEFYKIDRLADRMKEKIIGQDAAVDAVAKAIKRNRAGVAYKRKPVSFIFAGPTGVGKTELVKTLANDLFSFPETLIRLDMSEFMEKHSVSKLIGAPPGYVGYDEAGQLTEKIRRRPYSVVLFDEIEKAHPDVLNILLQVLDDGRITDAHGKEVNFENTLIVMTTNAGSDASSSVSGFAESPEVHAKERTEKALLGFLRPEFLNRVDEVITFNSLTKDDFKKIAHLMLDQLAAALVEKKITLTYTDAAADFIAEKSYSVKYGARNMRRYMQTEVEDALAEKIIASYDHRVTAAHVDADGEKLTITCM